MSIAEQRRELMPAVDELFVRAQPIALSVKLAPELGMPDDASNLAINMAGYVCDGLCAGEMV
jgi:hypothetical protein